MCRVSDLRCKEVVNLQDGVRLGYVDDLEFDIKTGCVTAIIVFGKARFFGLFGREEDCVILWDSIQKIGTDTVLVCYEAPSQHTAQPRKSGFFSSIFK